MWRMVFLVLGLLAGNQAAMAGEFHLIEKTFDIADIDTLDLDMHVGEAEVGPTSDDKIYLVLKVYARRNWYGRNKAAPEDAELDVRRSAKTLTLRLHDDDYREDWVVLVPARLAVDVDLGVGDIEIIGLSKDIALDVGVGDALVRATADNYRSANGDVGVGDVDISSPTGTVHNERAMVSAESNWRGRGDYAINVDVGVGDAMIDLE
jgi:hypothetical protein